MENSKTLKLSDFTKNTQNLVKTRNGFAEAGSLYDVIEIDLDDFPKNLNIVENLTEEIIDVKTGKRTKLVKIKKQKHDLPRGQIRTVSVQSSQRSKVGVPIKKGPMSEKYANRRTQKVIAKTIQSRIQNAAELEILKKRRREECPGMCLRRVRGKFVCRELVTQGKFGKDLDFCKFHAQTARKKQFKKPRLNCNECNIEKVFSDRDICAKCIVKNNPNTVCAIPNCHRKPFNLKSLQCEIHSKKLCYTCKTRPSNPFFKNGGGVIACNFCFYQGRETYKELPSAKPNICLFGKLLNNCVNECAVGKVICNVHGEGNLTIADVPAIKRLCQTCYNDAVDPLLYKLTKLMACATCYRKNRKLHKNFITRNRTCFLCQDREVNILHLGVCATCNIKYKTCSSERSDYVGIIRGNREYEIVKCNRKATKYFEEKVYCEPCFNKKSGICIGTYKTDGSHIKCKHKTIAKGILHCAEHSKCIGYYYEGGTQIVTKNGNPLLEACQNRVISNLGGRCRKCYEKYQELRNLN